jgi:hypothetical protein
MFKITLRPRSPLALHCLDMPPKDRNAELIRLADLGLAIERLGIGGQATVNNERGAVHQTKGGHQPSISRPSAAGQTEEQTGYGNENLSERVDFGNDLFQVGT